MPLRPFISIPQNLREWSRYLSSLIVIPDDGSITTDKLVDHAATLIKLQQIAGLTVLGNPTGAQDDVQQLTASVDGQLLRRAAGGLAFGTIPESSVDNLTSDLAMLASEIASNTADIATKANKSITLAAGAGLSGGGDLSSNRTFDVGAGTGITVNANDVALANIADQRVMGNVSGSAAAPIALTPAQIRTFLGRLDVFKAGDTTITSSTTLTDDPDLNITVEAATYDFECFLAFYEATLGTGGFQFDLGGGTATVGSILWGADGYVTAVAGNPAATAANTAQSYGTVATSSSAPSWVRVTGQVTFSGAGTFILRWAQASSSANGTTLKAKSFMTLQKVA